MRAASLLLVGLEVGNPDLRPFRQNIHKHLIPHIQCGQAFLVQFYLLIGQTPCFPDGGVIPSKGGKGRELCRTV